MQDDLDRIVEEIEEEKEARVVRSHIAEDLDRFVKKYYHPFKVRGFTIPEAYNALMLHDILESLNEDEEDEG